jgi:hypothetical protein
MERRIIMKTPVSFYECEICGKIFFKNQMVESYIDDDPELNIFMCHRCDSERNHPEENSHANNYYLEGLKTIDAEFKKPEKDNMKS